jgi:very-short-patch-repair endonuclease
MDRRRQKSEANRSAVEKCFDEHASRRSHGEPVLAYLPGPGDWAAACWHAFYSGKDIPAVETPTLLDEGLAARIAMLTIGHHSARDHFTAWLASRAGRATNQVQAVLRHGAPGEKKLLLEQAGTDGPEMDVLRFFPILQDTGLPEERGNPDPARDLAVLAEVLGSDAVPAILIRPPAKADTAAITAEIACAETIFTRLPELRIGLAVDTDTGRRVFAELAGTRRGALLEAGHVLPPFSEPDPEPGSEIPGEAAAARQLARIVPENARIPVMAAWREAAAAAAIRKAAAKEKKDRAHSAVERFLFAVLEAHPETRGRFRLNEYVKTHSARLPRTEVDFLAPSARLAVEVDGWYHFRDAEAWRRDRLKDLVLQQEGYTVARFLAEDVTRAADTVIDSILCALDAAEERRKRHE